MRCFIWLCAMRKTRPVMERIWEKTIPIPECGCYVFLGCLTEGGYGQIGRGPGGGMELVHRVAYEILVGPIPEGLTIDHKCRVRSCWRTDHLEPVTHRVNVLRGISPFALNARKTHCSNGHPYDEGNTYVYRDGRKRVCKTCVSAQTKKRHRLKREKAGKIVGITTACPRGHPYDFINTYIAKSGSPVCRKCRRESDRQRTPRNRKAK